MKVILIIVSQYFKTVLVLLKSPNNLKLEKTQNTSKSSSLWSNNHCHFSRRNVLRWYRTFSHLSKFDQWEDLASKTVSSWRLFAMWAEIQNTLPQTRNISKKPIVIGNLYKNCQSESEKKKSTIRPCFRENKGSARVDILLWEIHSKAMSRAIQRNWGITQRSRPQSLKLSVEIMLSTKKSVVGQSNGVLFIVWVYNDLPRKVLGSITGSSTTKNAVPKFAEVVSGVHSCILSSKKKQNGHWWKLFGSKNCRFFLVYNASCEGGPGIFLIHAKLEEFLNTARKNIYVSRRVRVTCNRVNNLKLAFL